MTTSPRLSRSIPFWLLIAGSLGSLAGGAYLLVDRLGGMDARLTDGTATTNDVYVGQVWAVFGAILIGAGILGLALALTVGALRTVVAGRTVAAEAAPVVERTDVEEHPATEHAEDAVVSRGATRAVVDEEIDTPVAR